MHDNVRIKGPELYCYHIPFKNQYSGPVNRTGFLSSKLEQAGWLFGSSEESALQPRNSAAGVVRNQQQSNKKSCNKEPSRSPKVESHSLLKY